MDKIDQAGLEANLAAGLDCALSHEGWEPDEPMAIDYIVIDIGKKLNKNQEEVVDHFVIPVCAECHDAMLDDLWTCVYCSECHDSKWIGRPWSKNKLQHDLIISVGCQNCLPEKVKARRVYFINFDRYTGGVIVNEYRN